MAEAPPGNRDVTYRAAQESAAAATASYLRCSRDGMRGFRSGDTLMQL